LIPTARERVAIRLHDNSPTAPPLLDHSSLSSAELLTDLLTAGVPVEERSGEHASEQGFCLAGLTGCLSNLTDQQKRLLGTGWR
jgi:hypothetical protein